MDKTTTVLISGLFFAVVFLSGIWLSRKGRPLKAGISAAHKLISLAAGVFLLVTIYQRSLVVPLDGAEWGAIAFTGICFLGTVASGGLLSSEGARPVAVLRVHQVVPVLTALASAVMSYLLMVR